MAHKLLFKVTFWISRSYEGLVVHEWELFIMMIRKILAAVVLSIGIGIYIVDGSLSSYESLLSIIYIGYLLTFTLLIMIPVSVVLEVFLKSRIASWWGKLGAYVVAGFVIGIACSFIVGVEPEGSLAFVAFIAGMFGVMFIIETLIPSVRLKRK